MRKFSCAAYSIVGVRTLSFVAVMDSGIGGLTVLRELQKVHKRCNFVYFADHAFCPYGTKPAEEVRQRVLDVASFLKNRGATSVVLACNTASVFASEVHKQLNMPVFDAILPTCDSVLQTTKSGKVVLFATSLTVKSGKYQKFLRRQGISVEALHCDCFVPLVEGNATPHRKIAVVRSRLQQLQGHNFDTAILGCTHFPFLLPQIAQCLPPCKIVNCASAMAQVFVDENVAHGGLLTCFSTGNAKKATHAASQFGYVFTHINF